MAQVTVSIDGKQYRMACDEGQEEHLIDLAERFDRYVMHLKDSFGEIGDQRLTVMAALTLGDELSEAYRRIRRLEAELAGVNETKAAVIARYEEAQAGFARAVDHVAMRLEGFADRLAADRD